MWIFSHPTASLVSIRAPLAGCFLTLRAGWELPEIRIALAGYVHEYIQSPCINPSCILMFCTGWWFGTFLYFFFIFPYFGYNNPDWLSYFSEGWVYHQPVYLSISYSYGHLLVITGYKWDYIYIHFLNGVFLVLITGITRAITVGVLNSQSTLLKKWVNSPARSEWRPCVTWNDTIRIDIWIVGWSANAIWKFPKMGCPQIIHN